MLAPSPFFRSEKKSQVWWLLCRVWVSITVIGKSKLKYWAWDLLVQSPNLQNPLPRWIEEDCPERCPVAPQTPSPAVQLCHYGCRPSLVVGSQRSQVVPGNRRKTEELIKMPAFHFSQQVWYSRKKMFEGYTDYTNYTHFMKKKQLKQELKTIDPRKKTWPRWRQRIKD